MNRRPAVAASHSSGQALPSRHRDATQGPASVRLRTVEPDEPPAAEGCPGEWQPIQNRTAAYCLSCARFGQTPSGYTPEATRDGLGNWHCANRVEIHNSTPAASSAVSLQINSAT